MRARALSALPALRFRAIIDRIVHFWRASLQWRTVAITVVLSGLAVTIVVTYMSVSIGNNLFNSRIDGILAEASRANQLAQSIFESDLAIADATRTDLESLGVSVNTAIRGSTTSPGGIGVALMRTPGQETPVTMQPSATYGFPEHLITDTLRESVAANAPADRAWWQPVQLADSSPGVAVGSLLTVPNAGFYELYLVYDLGDTQDTLTFVQQTLTLGAVVLVLLIAVVAYVVARIVVGPVRLAAETSQRLAAGELEVRIPERGEDVIATLARSFNDMADSLQRQITQLAELSRVQQRFVADVSHELRTPLTTIRLAGDVLYDQRESFDPATGRTAELLHTQIQRFETLLADLLEVSRYDAGAIELELEETNLARLVEDVVESMRLIAAERGSDIRLVAEGGYSPVEVDPRRIRRILRNLIGNAIEHGESKPIVVTIDSNETTIALTVQDQGVGIDEDLLPRVFDRFWRADPSRQRTLGGTGLGLAIALEDAALHGGAIDVWSRKGVGTCFRLQLPRVPGAPLGDPPLDLPPAGPLDALEVNGG